MLQFFVESLTPDGLVIGRNGNGDIPVGTTFTAIRQSRVDRGPNALRTEDLGDVGSVSLILREVHWYHRTIEFIPGGHTAGLRLAGDGLPLLAWLLRELPPGHYLSLIGGEGKTGTENGPEGLGEARDHSEP